MSQFVTVNGEQFTITKAVVLVDGNGAPYAGPNQRGPDNSIMVNGEPIRIQEAAIVVGSDGQPLTSI